MTMPKKNIYSVILDKETIEQVTKLQKKTNTFSRSQMLRKLIKLGLESEK